jgi:hypothetical protein
MSDYCQQKDQENLDLLMLLDRPERIGPTFVQRHLKIGYNQAMHCLMHGVETGVLERIEGSYCFKTRQGV